MTRGAVGLKSLLPLGLLLASGQGVALPTRAALGDGLALKLAAPAAVPWLESGQAERSVGSSESGAAAAAAGEPWLWASILGGAGFGFDVGASAGAALAISAQDSFRRSTVVNVAGSMAGGLGVSLLGGGLGYLLGRSAQLGSKAARVTAVVLDALAAVGSLPAGAAIVIASQLGPQPVLEVHPAANL